MQLSDFDEYPFHQHPTPYNIPSTSDVHFNDGYYCAIFSDDWYVATGVRLHPNMNVIDGFAGLARKGEQRVVRSSRALRPRSADLAVGPICIEIRKPMNEVALSLAENDAGFTFELTLLTKSPPFLEAALSVPQIRSPHS